MDAIDAVLRSTIGRLVALLTPLLAGVIAALLYKVQNWIGIDLQVDPAVAASFVGSVILGGCLVGLKWLENRGRFETAALAIAHAHELGVSAVTVESGGVKVGDTPVATDDNEPAPGVQPSDSGTDPDDGTEDFIGQDPTVPPGVQAHEPLE